MPDLPTDHATGGSPISVVVVDDHDLLRQGVIVALGGADDIKVVGEARDGISAIDVINKTEPTVVLMDLIMPTGGGIDAIRSISERWPDIRVLALTSFSEADLVREALTAGATSYVMKNVNTEALIDAVRTTAGGHSAMAPEIARELAFGSASRQNDALQTLTERELEVADLLSQGLSNAQIATELNRSLYTVKNHVSNVLTKLNVKSRTEAVALIFRQQAD